MNRLYSRAGAFALTSALCLVSVGRLSAQTTAAPAAPAAKAADEETIVLSPFVVEASEDQGYSAKDTLAGTRVRTELKDIASAITVVTQKFLQDTGAKNSADLLVYTPSTEVGGIRGNFSGVAGTSIAQENTISNTTRVRGLDSADNTRDYFLTDIPWDGFNVGRVDLQRGPNSILFGTGSPAGIINTSVNDAAFKTKYNVENRLDEYGSVRNSIDLNQNLVPGVIAIRFAAVDDNQKFEQKPAFNHSKRYYGALRIEPKLFGENNHTSLRVKFEDGDVKSNNPRTIPPVDDISLWFKKGQDKYGHYGYDKLLINQFSTQNVTPWGTLAPGAKGGGYAGGLQLANAIRSFWPDITNYYEQTNPAINSVANSPIPSGTSLRTIANQPNIGLSSNGSGGNALQGVNPNYLPLAIPMPSTYYRDIGTNNNNANSTNPGASTPIPGGIYYNNVELQDPSIFNFYKLLGDGPNKHEWQKWHAFDVALEQQLWDNRIGLQLAYDHQDYTAGAEQWMTGENYNINIDINATFADGTANPNAGRPYFGNGASAPGLNYQNRTVREGIRFTPTLEINTADFLGKSKLSEILGKHNFTSVLERTTVKKDYMNWAEYATTAEYPQSGSLNLNAANTLNSNRSFEWIAYIGPSLISKASPAGAKLTNITSTIAPPTSQYARVFNSNWNKPTNPSDPAYVDPASAYSYVNYQNGNTVVGTQRDNPANYVGWTTQNINWMRSSNPSDFPSLVEAANRTRVRNLSEGFTWQGYLLGGDFVPTVGWRKDVLTSYETHAYTDPLSGYTSLDYDDNLSSRTDVRGESKSWGGVYHLPKKWTSRLPGNTTISLFYNRSSNFKADASRLDLAGNQIPNATGQTKEYGVTITTFNDKLTLKVNKFKTKVSNATLNGTDGNSIAGLGNNAYFIADGSIWGWAWASSVQEGLAGNTPNSNFFDAANADGLPHNTPTEIAAYNAYNRTGGTFTDTNGANHTYVGGNAIVDAWLHAPFPKNFFSSYSLTPQLDPTLAYKSGRLVDAYVGGIPGGFAGGVPTGGGSSFGNHQTTVDTLSSGTEVELLYQPVKNWNISVNYAKVSATRENIDPVSQAFLSTMTKFMNGPGGQVREWFNGGGTVGAQWNSSIVAPYAVTVNQLGHEAPEVSPWRLNAVSTYQFDHGFLKGVFVGGALRIEAGRILGYEFDPTFKNSITSDPNYAAVLALTQGGLNVNKPLRGPSDDHVDAWVGYNRKITSKLNWRIQLNVRDVGKKDRLTPAGINPDGSISLVRIQQGMGFQLTNSFDF